MGIQCTAFIRWSSQRQRYTYYLSSHSNFTEQHPLAYIAFSRVQQLNFSGSYRLDSLLGRKLTRKSQIQMRNPAIRTHTLDVQSLTVYICPILMIPSSPSAHIKALTTEQFPSCLCTSQETILSRAKEEMWREREGRGNSSARIGIVF
jgi:hypothetical protein